MPRGGWPQGGAAKRVEPGGGEQAPGRRQRVNHVGRLRPRSARVAPGGGGGLRGGDGRGVEMLSQWWFYAVLGILVVAAVLDFYIWMKSRPPRR